jgi:hypothetical protein
MSPYQAITLDFKPMDEPVTHTDFTYSITPTTISITDTGKGKVSVTNDICQELGKTIVFLNRGATSSYCAVRSRLSGTMG